MNEVEINNNIYPYTPNYRATETIQELESNLRRYCEQIDAHNHRFMEIIHGLVQMADEREQLEKRNNIRMFGLDEKYNKNLIGTLSDIFHIIGLPTVCMENCYRSGAPGKTRSVLIKFFEYDDKLKVLSRKKLLLNYGIVVAEDLTKLRVQRFFEARRKYGIENVWTLDGDIYAKNGHSVINVLDTIPEAQT